MAVFCRQISTAFEADYAVAHILTHAELEERLEEHLRDVRAVPAVSFQLSQSARSEIEKSGFIGLTQRELATNIQGVTIRPPGGSEAVARESERMNQRIHKEGFARVLWEMTVMQHTTVKLEKCLPDLCWLTVFGRPYVEMFGRAGLLATPAHEVRELPSGSISVRLTEGLEDTPSAWQSFRQVRDRCKAHLDRDAFFDPVAPATHIYRVPQFHFPRDMHRPSSAGAPSDTA
jgi:hypothetical protein